MSKRITINELTEIKLSLAVEEEINAVRIDPLRNGWSGLSAKGNDDFLAIMGQDINERINLILGIN